MSYYFEWSHYTSPTFGIVYRATIPIQIESSSKEWEEFIAEVDSGSVISLFNKSDCESLGYILEEGRKFPLYGVLGSFTYAYMHDLNLKIGEDIIKARVAFVDRYDQKQLLGRTDVFNKFHICLDGNRLMTEITKS